MLPLLAKNFWGLYIIAWLIHNRLFHCWSEYILWYGKVYCPCYTHYPTISSDMVGVLSTAVLYTNNYSHITRRYALHRVIIFFFCLQMGRVNLVVIRIFWLFNLHYPKYRCSFSTGNMLVYDKNLMLSPLGSYSIRQFSLIICNYTCYSFFSEEDH